ncbi:vacuolar protein sorting-associated protein 11 homolog [Drosophila rhopaloa]|uniref:Vacuolar protein sorting-associated protein 11 homolog n=1 Tax=Drosophila rhopaloa TaxID=1041015 RepID=A0A6P4EA61_DRORH|nr:vacuolar protein sorting-associated protein 11 homolog [Drosophila rhopaloa]
MDTSVLEWKKVDLFNIIALPYVKCPTTSEISCYCCNDSKSNTEDLKIRIVICDQNKNIHVYPSSWDCISFKSQATRNIIRLCSLTSNNWLATATQDINFGIYIDIYDLRRLTKKQGAPIIGSAFFQVASTASCIDAEVIDEKFLAVAIGLECGDILLHYGKINRLFSQNIRQHTVSGYPINGVHFDIKAQQSDMQTKIMFVTCFQGVYCFELKDKSCMDKRFMLDNDNDTTYNNHCCTMRKTDNGDLEESMLVVGREDAVYCYTHDGRGPCFAIKGTKKCLAWVGHYLVVAISPKKSILSTSTIIVVDTDNKIIVFQKQFQDFFCTISEENFCYFISNTPQENTCNVFMLEQHNISSTIRLLVEKNMYDIALRFLHREGSISSPEAAFVRFQYGNHLLLKGDISRAVKEFIKTIGFVKPYAVISKLAYSRYNSYLIDYLSEWIKIDKTSKYNTALIECCMNRKQIEQKMQQLTDGVDSLNFTRPLVLKDLSDLSKMFFECTLRNQDKVEGDSLLHRFLEYGSETLLVDPTTYLEHINSENVKKCKNILSFISILTDQNDYCAKILANIIETFPACDEKLYYYLLVLYLDLWRGNKVTTCFVLDFLKKDCLRLDKVLIICRLYSFFNGLKEIHNFQQSAGILHHETINKCIHTLIKNNPEVGLNLSISKRSFLMMLKSFCSNNEVKVFKIKPVFKEEIMRQLVDSSNELQLIEHFQDNIKRSSCILSLYTNNPIEFRNDTCDICRETLNMQSIYFLCQHSFHKECLNYSLVKRQDQIMCAVCKANTQIFNEENKNNFNSDSSNIIAVIAKVVALGIMNLGNKSIIDKSVQTITQRNGQSTKANLNSLD